MFRTDKLKALVNERLTAAAEELFSIFEQTIKEYEETVFRLKQEVDQQRRRAGGKAPLQLSVQENDAHSEQSHCERTTGQCEDEQEPPHIKEEQEEELWSPPTGDKQQEEADTKDSMFNIIYVQRSDGDGRRQPHQTQTVETKGDCLPSGSSEQLKSEPDDEGCSASKPTSDCEMSEFSEDEFSGGFHSGINKTKPQQAGETADRPHTCSVCSKTFRIKSILTRHMKTHTGEKPYSCSVCGKSFIQRSYLQTHMNSHSGQKPYTCSFCGRGFTQVGNMNAHIRIHTGEKPHSCADCGKSFREKADLIKHTIIHTGEKPYICSVCNMKFSAQSNLTRHMKTHSGERPYSCTACGKRFIRRSHLIIHMKTHAGENL
ncbi:endothelial zinc finger protein induced by tumor necrosis factor alpha-like [Chaetodon trifascialis]|uniref:endothelial zinc finger protein induced by tumor necrosis factor alpha-like n=1 Tax=Chaetodon trifascialis TaxID=109706 RepID=UPI0039962C06